MNTREMLNRCAGDAPGRLRWRVMQRLGICPASLRGRLLSRRAAMGLACQLILDSGGDPDSVQSGSNPGFDMARFAALARGGAP